MNANTIMDTSGEPGGDAGLLSTATLAETCDSPGIQPVVRIREEHNISRRDIDPDALKVLYRLARNNYIAYLVGGGVRDLLLGRKPKDFDVSTNARPEQIRALFRNCILIGRRFRLAHVRYGDKIIETSTFRSTPKQEADPADPEADLFQRDDNLFGSPQEDALRRDFTVNGLFYDIESFSIIDYVGGMEDLAARRIRCIGDPCIRFREDPVRMIRAVRFASRLDFSLDPDTEDAIHRHGDELAKAAPARLLEEIARLFAFAAGEKAVRLLQSTGLLRVILPEVSRCLESDKGDPDLVWRRLKALDQGDTVHPDATPALVFAVILLEPLKRHLDRNWSFDDTPRLKFDKVHAFLDPLAQRLKFPRKLTDRIVHMYITQHRFANPGNRGKRGSIANFVTQEAFHESLALAEIVLTSEGGSQARLNQWRDMLAERIYGREEGSASGSGHGHGHSQDRQRGRRSGNDERGQEEEHRQPAAATEADADASDASDPFGDKKLSRSARRRRNKRMRRLRSPGDAAAPATADESLDGAESTSVPLEREDARKADEAKDGSFRPEGAAGGERGGEKTESAKEGRQRDRRGRNRKRDSAAKAAPKASEEVREEEYGKPLPPLTAAAFWTAAQPEPEPESEPALEEKKKRGGKKAKAEAKGKKLAKAKSDQPGDSKPAPAREAPLQMDRADDANTPMHWLDEI